jgi:hypothetical protein
VAVSLAVYASLDDGAPKCSDKDAPADGLAIGTGVEAVVGRGALPDVVVSDAVEQLQRTHAKRPR